MEEGDWETGQTGIGYGDDDDVTVIDDMEDNYVTIFCRKEFTVSDLDAIDDLVLSITIDDGFYAYINGTQVASHNVSSPAWDASASGAGEPNLQEREVANFRDVLRVGVNVLAVQVHNAGAGSSDLSFIPRLVSRTTEFAEGAEQLTNGDFETNTRGWMIEGTHIRSGRTTAEAINGNGSLKILASARGDNKVNRIETPEANGFGLADLQTGEDLQISFTARWIVGSQTILTHGYRQGMAKSHELAVPENLGTPGAINSVTLRQIDRVGNANLGPVIKDVVQVPAVPGNNEDVTVYARISDSDGVSSARLRYSLENASASPSSRNMTHLGDGVWSATIPGQALGTKVVFYVTANDGAGQSGRYPIDIAERTHPLLINPGSAPLAEQRHLVYRHHELLPSTPYHSYRFWMTASDESRLRSRRRQSNDKIWGSFVYGATDMYYEAQTRFAGSPFARGGIGGSYRVVLPRDKPLHERTRKFTLDNRHGSGTNARERTTHYLTRYNQGAITVPYLDTLTMVRWQLNDATTQTLENVWTPDAQFLSRWFPGDDDGDLYEVDDRFVIDDNGNRAGNTNAEVKYPPSSAGSDGDGENEENYRWFFNLRSKNGADDYASMIALGRLMDPSATSNAAFDEQVWDLVDVEQFLRIWTIRQGTDDWDTWGTNRGKNCYLYRPEKDARFRLLLQDAELTYGNPGAFMIPDNPESAFNPGRFGEVHRMLNRPKIKRMYYAILDEMVNGPDSFFHSDHMSAYMTRLAAMGMSNTQIGMPGGFIDQRADRVRPRIASSVSTAFRITTNSGRDITTDQPTVDIAGTAPVTACEILVNGESYPVVFTSMSAWRIDDITVPPGAHELMFIGFDLRGGLVGSDSLTVTNTNVAWDPPAITNLDPPSALPGDDIHITGTELHNGVRVFFGATESPAVVYDEGGATPGTIVARVPAGSGQVDVRVRNLDGQQSNSLPFEFAVPPPTFRRGDVNGDRRLDVSDPIQTLRYLFAGVAIHCEDAADVDDNEAIEVTDAVRSLDFLFRNGPAPAAPFPDPGPDPDGEVLGCER